MTTRETRETNLRIRLLEEELAELRRALAEHASDSYAVSRTEQVAAGGKPALARVLASYRAGSLQTAERRPPETR